MEHSTPHTMRNLGDSEGVTAAGDNDAVTGDGCAFITTGPEVRPMNSIEDTQKALEAEMVSAGKEAFEASLRKARERGQESTTAYGQTLLQTWVLPLAQAIKDFILRNESGKPGIKAAAYRFLIMVEPEVSAYITTKVVLDNITKSAPYTEAAMEIGRMVEDEARFGEFHEKKPGLFKVIADGIETDNYNHRRAVLIHKMKRYGVQWLPWTQKDWAQVGSTLVEMLVDVTGGVLEVTSPYVEKKRMKRMIKASTATEKWVADRVSKSEFLSPCFTPMVSPPLQWSSFSGGGYLTQRLKRGIVKVRGPAYDSYVKEWDQRGEELDNVYSSINALQDTAWQINPQVHSVILEAWDRDMDIAGLPIRDPLPLPPKPADKDTNRAALFAWKREATKVYTSNAKLASKRILASRLIQVSKKYSEFPRIYFPHQFDFRGRLYAIPLFLNPQGCDMAKGLLRYAEGKPLGTQRAADWLAIHGANLYGYDKVDFEGRIKWVMENTEKIVLSASNPLLHLWWSEADDPWQFLGFCFEWAEYVKLAVRGRGLTFVSHLPIALDGSCNGLQHFSAMLRDPVGGKAVNLLPGEKPQDIYQAVADKTKELLAVDKASPYSAKWLSFGIDRKMTKRPVMVVPYGGTKFSCRQYVRLNVLERTTGPDAEDFPFDPKETKKATSYLAKVIWDAIGEVVVSARKAMDYLQKVSRVAAKANRPCSWQAPSGFPVLQRYTKLECACITTRTPRCGKVQIKVARDTNALDAKRQEQGISPNFVHSLDAAALVFTVVSAGLQGIRSFAMIHDSYATHACDTDVLAQCCRISFVECVYSRDVLADFTEQVRAMLPDEAELPPIPEKGTLDLSLVLDSPFFFA